MFLSRYNFKQERKMEQQIHIQCPASSPTMPAHNSPSLLHRSLLSSGLLLMSNLCSPLPFSRLPSHLSPLSIAPLP